MHHRSVRRHSRSDFVAVTEGRTIRLALACLFVTFTASCSSQRDQQASPPESATTSAASSTVAPTAPSSTEPPAPEAGDFVIALADLPDGYGWTDRAPLLGPTPQSVHEVVRVISGDAAASCTEGALISGPAPRSQAASAFAQQYDSFVSTQAFQVAATYDSDEQARSVITSDVASRIASCISEAASRGDAYAPGNPDSALSADSVVTASPDVFLPGTYGDESQVSRITIEAPSAYSTVAVAAVRVGPKVSMIAIIDPVVDQEHDLLSIVARKMGGDAPPAPEMGME